MSNSIIFLISLMVLAGIIGLSAFDSQQAFAASSVISDDSTGGDCGTLGGTWNDETNTCTVTNLVVIDSEDSLTVNESVTVTFQGGAGDFSGSLDNSGTIINNGTMEFVGGVGKDSGELRNKGTLTNDGSMEFIGGAGDSSGGLFNDSTLTNDGSMEFIGGAGDNSGVLNNHLFGTVNNSCNGIITGTVTGDEIIQKSPCISD